jgi:hypothetical protein
MRAKWVGGVLVAVAAMWPSAASACDLFGAYGAHPAVPGTMSIVGSIHVEPGDDGEDTLMVPSVGLGIPLGARFTVAPVLGYCTGGDDSELVLGGFGAVNFISNDQWALGVQSHLARVSDDFGSYMSIPVVAAATFDVTETARLYADFGLRFARESPDEGESNTESDPVAAGGITFPLGSLSVTGGIVLVNGDEDTDFSFGGRLAYALGG